MIRLAQPHDSWFTHTVEVKWNVIWHGLISKGDVCNTSGWNLNMSARAIASAWAIRCLNIWAISSAWFSKSNHMSVSYIKHIQPKKMLFLFILTFSKTSLGLRIMSPGVGSSFFVERLTRPLSRSWLSIITYMRQNALVLALLSMDMA